MIDNSATRLVKITVISMQMSITIPIVIDHLITDYSHHTALISFAFMLTAVNFFHGKVATLDDRNYNRTVTFYPLIGLADFILNLLSIFCFIFIAFVLKKPLLLIVANISLRVFDSLLVLIIRNISADPQVRKAQKIWLFINVFSIILFAFTLIHFKDQLDNNINKVAMIYLIISVSDIAIDYTLNNNLYFPVNASWELVAEYWDLLQGQTGDTYRRKIILPKLKEVYNQHNCSKLLDMGCGNGCISRFFSNLGSKVTAIDKYNTMIEVAKRYSSDNIEYLQVDLETTNEEIHSGNFDFIIACFTLQDCSDLNNPFKFIEKNLAGNGVVAIVFENEESFEGKKNSSSTTTRRLWKDSKKKNGMGRRQLIFWEPKAILLGQGIEAFNSYIASDLEQSFATINHYWGAQTYIDIAAKNNLSVLSNDPLVSFEKDETNPILRRYSVNPAFSILIFNKSV